MFTPDHLAGFLPRFERAQRILIGYSGGLDSRVLLQALVQLLGPEKLTALHINHQLSPNASHWQAHCAEQCRELDVALQAFHVSVAAGGEGLEQAARVARYQVFQAALGEGDVLLLAHHADDQAETVLYRLMRCSGPRGLAGMPRQRPLGEGELLRPLLDVSRAELKAYAVAEGLQWIEDESNQLLDFDRNFLRHRVVPVLQERWPDLAGRLSQVAHLCGQSDELVSELAAMDLANAQERDERVGSSIRLDVLAGLSQPRRHNVLRYWLNAHGYAMPPLVRIRRIHRELIAAKDDANPLIDLGDCELRRYNGRVYLLPPLPLPPPDDADILWDTLKPLAIAGVGVLTARTAIEGGVSVRFRRGGERCKPLDRHRSQSLKKLLHEHRLEPWLRDRVPLLFKNDVLLAAGDLFFCNQALADCGLCWQVMKKTP